MIHDKVIRGKAKVTSLDLKGILKISAHDCVPKFGGWIKLILKATHYSKY